MTTNGTGSGAREVPVDVKDSAGAPEWGSDVVMDLLRLLDIEYAAVLPGATFRGIHDSAVNYTVNQRPEMILCNQEMVTVALARGYTRVTGKVMAVMVHNVVGLLQASMNIFDAWCDRVPVLVLGGTGPVDSTQRRPWIDWIHTANLQGNLVRDYTKWDDQPASVAAIPESMLRAHRIAVTDPPGPVYVCFDRGLQEEKIEGSFPLPDVDRFRPSAPPVPDAASLRRAAELLVGAEMPIAFPDRVGRDAASVLVLVELAELLAMPVIDTAMMWHNFPTPHALDFFGLQQELLADCDVALGLDPLDLANSVSGRDLSSPEGERPEGDGPTVINVSVDELIHRSLSTDYQALPAVDLPILSTPAATLPVLLEECRALLDDEARARIERRRQALEPRQAELRQRQQARRQATWDNPEITEYRMVAELWELVKDEDYIFTHGLIRRMAPGVCAISGPEQSVAGAGGGAVGSGMGLAVGAGLALKGTGKLPVAFVGDGEYLASVQALWTAAHYRIPTLFVILNNRSYYNDEAHQEHVAKVRGRPVENKRVAMRMEDPEVDFGALARSFDVAGEGPIRDASELAAAYRRGIDAVKGGAPYVIDVWTANRPTG